MQPFQKFINFQLIFVYIFTNWLISNYDKWSISSCTVRTIYTGSLSLSLSLSRSLSLSLSLSRSHSAGNLWIQSFMITSVNKTIIIFIIKTLSLSTDSHPCLLSLSLSNVSLLTTTSSRQMAVESGVSWYFCPLHSPNVCCCGICWVSL